MIKLLRVDERLIHGEVAATWTNSIGADSILIAVDDIDPLVVVAMKLSVPAGVKLVILNIEESIKAINNGKTDSYNLFIIVQNVTDAYRLAKGCNVINEINIGRTKKLEGTESLNKNIHVTSEQRKMLEELVSDGYKIDVQVVPSVRAVPLERIL